MLRRFSVRTGVAIGLVGSVVGFALILFQGNLSDQLSRFLILALSFGLLAYFPHCLAHFAVGEVTGIRFSYYVFGGSPLANGAPHTFVRLDRMLPRLGIRLTRESRRNATHRQRLYMFSSGVVASTLLPIVPSMISYSSLSGFLGDLLPLAWILYLLFGAYFSPRYGDLSRINPRY